MNLFPEEEGSGGVLRLTAGKGRLGLKTGPGPPLILSFFKCACSLPESVLTLLRIINGLEFSLIFLIPPDSPAVPGV